MILLPLPYLPCVCMHACHKTLPLIGVVCFWVTLFVYALCGHLGHGVGVCGILAVVPPAFCTFLL